MLRLRMALRKARQAESAVVEVQVEDLERLMLQNQQMDQRLAQCMSKLSREEHLAIFGDMFDTEAAENKA